MIHNSRFQGAAWLAAGAALLSALAYEPAWVMQMVRLDETMVSEATVVAAGLALVALCTVQGLITLRRGRLRTTA